MKPTDTTSPPGFYATGDPGTSSLGAEDESKADEGGDAKSRFRSEAIQDPYETIHIDFTSSDWQMADLMGVNRGVYTEGRYGERDKSVPSDYTRFYQSVGVTSVRTHGDCFDVANIFGLFPSDEKSLASVPTTHGIDVEEYKYIDQVLGPQEVMGAGIEQLRRDLQEAWHDLFEANGRALTWDETHLPELAASCDRLGFAVAHGVVGYTIGHGKRSWLYWHPRNGSDSIVDDNYRYEATGVRAAFQALLDAGIEVYFRLGESMGGPTAVAEQLLPSQSGSNIAHKEYYADVAAAIVDDLAALDPASNPFSHLEIWNEPDGAFYADCHDGNAVAFGEDFAELYKEIKRRIHTSHPAWSIGGSGFTRGGMQWFVEGSSKKVREILQCADTYDLSDPSDVPPSFLSFHWYSNRLDQTSKPLIDAAGGGVFVPEATYFRERALAFASDLDSFTSALRSFCSSSWGLPEGSQPEIHVSEWNIQLPAAGDRPDADRNWCVGVECAPFVAAAMAWMQSPRIDVKQAHFFAGHDRAGGLFHLEWTEVVPDSPAVSGSVAATPTASGQVFDGPELELQSGGIADPGVLTGTGAGGSPPASIPTPEHEILDPDAAWISDSEGTTTSIGSTHEYQFKVRASAVAMSLFSDVAGQSGASVTIGDSKNPKDVIDAAAAGTTVTALGFSSDDSQYSFVLTNLSARSRQVNIELLGIPAASYSTRTRRIDTTIPRGGFTVPFGDLEWTIHERWRPRSGVAEAAIEACIQESTLGIVESLGTNARLELGMEIEPYGVVRVDLTENVFL